MCRAKRHVPESLPFHTFSSSTKCPGIEDGCFCFYSLHLLYNGKENSIQNWDDHTPALADCWAMERFKSERIVVGTLSVSVDLAELHIWSPWDVNRESDAFEIPTSSWQTKEHPYRPHAELAHVSAWDVNLTKKQQHINPNGKTDTSSNCNKGVLDNLF